MDLLKKANFFKQTGAMKEASKLYEQLIEDYGFFDLYYQKLISCYDETSSLVSKEFLEIQKNIEERKNFDYSDAYTFNAVSVTDQMLGLNINEKTVLVVIPAYNCGDTIEESIISVLNQTYRDVWVVVVDDFSDDNTVDIIRKVKRHNDRVSYLTCSKNVGTYNAVNLGLYAASKFAFGYFLIHGADDVMDKNKIALQIKSMDDDRYKASITGYSRVDRNSNKLIKVANKGHSMAIYSSEVFRKLGFFDDTRFGGDSEYWERFLSCHGNNSFKLITKQLTKAYVLGTNLTSNNPDSSTKRLNYANKFKSEHKSMEKIKNWGKSFDIERVFGHKGRKIICGLATVEGRELALKDTILSIIDQVDEIIVYQNGYRECFDFLHNRKISIISSLDTGIDMGDAGKFFLVGHYKDVYYFSIDDDLIYPEDYVEKCIHELKKYDDKVIVTHHGRIMKDNPKSYYKDIKENYRCLDEVSVEKEIDFGGTGVMCFNTKYINFTFNDCKAPNMADIWMGKYAKERNIPIIVLKHEAGWITHSDKFDQNETIFRKYKSKHRVQDRMLLDMFSKNQHSKNKKDNIVMKKKVVFLTCSYKRVEVTEIFKYRLDQLQNKYKNHFDFFNVVIDSEYSNFEVFKGDSSYIYYNHDNFPISNKWQYGVNCAKDLNFDYLFIIGSDNTIDNEIFERYIEYIDCGYDLIGMTDMHILSYNDKKLYYWPGYPKKHKRYGESIGLGRCISKRVLETLDYQLWDDGLNRGLDGNMTAKFKTRLDNSYTNIEFSIKNLGIACDIKAGFNISNIDDFLPLCNEIVDNDVVTKYLESIKL